jgi:hypothetical protein
MRATAVELAPKTPWAQSWGKFAQIVSVILKLLGIVLLIVVLVGVALFKHPEWVKQFLPARPAPMTVNSPRPVAFVMPAEQLDKNPTSPSVLTADAREQLGAAWRQQARKLQAAGVSFRKDIPLGGVGLYYRPKQLVGESDSLFVVLTYNTSCSTCPHNYNRYTYMGTMADSGFTISDSLLEPGLPLPGEASGQE